MISFGPNELFNLIFPGLFHELKTLSKYPEMFTGTISAPSRYQLPNYICPDKLTEQLRITLADAFVFIHTWCEEHPNTVTQTFLDRPYTHYNEFFPTMFKVIRSQESDPSIRDIAINLEKSVKRISPYLGVYHGNLKYSVLKTKEVINAMIFILCLTSIFPNPTSQ